MPARQLLEMPGRYGFHSIRPAPWEASQCGVERRPPVQERSELQAHEATMLQCLAVEVRKGLSKGLTERYEGLWRSPLKPTTSATGHKPTSSDLPGLVRSTSISR